VEALFHYLYCGVLAVTVERMTLRYKRGWSQLGEKLPLIAARIAKECRAYLARPVLLIDQPSNNVDAYFKDVKILIDTVPIFCRNLGQSEVLFQPKYASHVVKINAAVSTTGFFVEFPDSIYTGRCPTRSFLTTAG
jgi:hypothetical protein